MNLNKNEKVRLGRVGGTLIAAITKLDERGMDETVSRALSIVHTVIASSIRGKIPSPKKANDITLIKLKMEKEM